MDLVIQQYAEAQRKFYSNTAGQKYFNEYWNAHARDFLTVSNETNREFRDKFYMRAKEFNVELLARGVRNLNGNNMRPSMMVATILDTGDLAGVHPIRDLADYLEISARSLP